MSYFLRSFNPVDFLAYALLSLAWAAGGWLLARRAFRLRKREEALAGLATGFVLWMTLANLLAGFLPAIEAFWLGALLVLGWGVGAEWRGRREKRVDWNELRLAWPLLVALAALTALFELIQRGQAIFDDYLHLPLVSILAAGDFPPHFYLNPELHFAYHYALQVWAASLVRQLGMFPWSAWDLAKAFAIALTLVLGWIWVKRLTGSRLAAWLGTIAFTFGGGARWLLLLLPPPWLASLSQAVTLINTGADTAPNLQAALFRPWASEGIGPLPFPFAAHNGVFVPVISVLGSTGALPFLTILLLLLLLPGRKLSWSGGLVVGLILANLALSAEHLFAFLWIGAAAALIWARPREKEAARQAFGPWLLALGLSAALSLVQGGFITEVARGAVGSVLGQASGEPNNAYGFSLRWPPAVYSAHLGILSLFNWKQVIVMIAELGPAVFLAPLATVITARALRAGRWALAALGIGAWINMIFPLFIQYGVDRSITRMPGTALWLWLVLCLPFLWFQARRSRAWLRGVLGAGYVVTVAGAAVIFAVMLANARDPKLSNFIDTPDAQVSREYWDRLEPHAQVLDSSPSRGVTVFGRASRASQSIYVPLADWQALVADPDPVRVARAGYEYIYIDGGWWNGMAEAQRRALGQGCVKVVAEVGEGERSRRLLNVGACRN
ncbi:MAG TPA: hypothetical protein VMT46_18450 [Anaerolineaceae bacterium]|nr:hypothetical protein [Anaerolineaceae bacterium]